MATKIFFPLLFISFLVGFTQIRAADNLYPIHLHSTFADVCNVPAPDSFRVTGTTGPVISLTWHPVSFGTLHTLTVLEKHTSGNWNLLYSYYNVPGEDFDVSSMQYGREYRFVIATNCNNGETSDLTRSIDFINLILDLTLAGRTPLNPEPLEGCPSINYQTNNWVGFSIQAPRPGGNLITKYFEFAEGSFQGEPIPAIKRDDNFWLVASNLAGEFPIQPFPLHVLIQGSYSFEIFHRKGFPIPYHIGTLKVVDFQPANKTVKICKDQFNWDQNYLFTMLTATSTAMFSQSINDGRNEEPGIKPFASKKRPIVQTPFTDLLTISFPEQSFEQGEAFIQLLNTAGQVLFASHFDATLGQVSLPVESFSIGLYILRIEIDGNPLILKVVKAE